MAVGPAGPLLPGSGPESVGSGGGISFSRSYNALDTRSSTLGPAWNQVAVKDGRGNTTNFCYDGFDQVVRVVGPAPTSGGSAERVVEYAYDGLVRVRTETQYSGTGTTGPLVMQTTYDANSNRATVTDQLSRTTSYSYDALNRLTEIDYSDAGTPNAEYSYDLNGRRLTMLDGTGTTSYTYDALDRLLSVTTPASPSNKTVGYRYDR